MIGAAALSGATVNIPHFTSSAAGHAPRLLQMIARARAHGLAITAEDSPYIEGVIRIGPGEMDSWSDREIQEIQPMEADERLTRESYARYRVRAFVAIAHNDLAEPRLKPSLAEALANPHVSVASHGSGGVLTPQGRGHPRTSGTFSRVLGRYVREEGVLSLMEALRKMALMPAQRFESRVPVMRNKGRIRVGADADIVVFDAEKIIDRATFQEQRTSQGVRHVLVNGVFVVRDGVIEEGLFAGRPIRANTGRRSGDAGQGVSRTSTPDPWASPPASRSDYATHEGTRSHGPTVTASSHRAGDLPTAERARLAAAASGRRERPGGRVARLRR